MKTKHRIHALLLAGAAALLSLSGCGETATNPAVQTTLPAAARGAGAADAPVLDKSATVLVAEKAVSSAPVFRFAKISNGAYFYTGSAGEKDVILAGYPDFRCEGLAFFRSSDGSGVPVYRFANLNSGGYFYTADVAERDFVIATRPDMRAEGSTFSVASKDTAGAQPVYRLANLSNGAYLFTARALERDYAVGLGNWRDEGIAFYGAPTDDTLSAVNWCAAPGVLPTVSGVSASVLPLKYLAPTLFRVTGANLDTNISFAASNCAGIVEQAGGTAISRSFACSPNATGKVSFKVLASDGSVVWGVEATIAQPQVKLATSMGDIVVQLDPAKTPATVANFLQYARDGFYNGLIFHRVESDFVIQGGGFNSALAQKTTRPPVALESLTGLSNVRGTIAMARTDAADSATSQFFINLVDNLFLNYASAARPGYAAFGTVVQGLDVVDLIRAVPVGTQVQAGTQLPYSKVPVTPVTINTVTQTQ